MIPDEYALFDNAIILILIATIMLLVKGHLREYYSRRAKEATDRSSVEYWNYYERIIVPELRFCAIFFYIGSFISIIYGILKLSHYIK